jgi:hypothetical protein
MRVFSRSRLAPRRPSRAPASLECQLQWHSRMSQSNSPALHHKPRLGERTRAILVALAMTATAALVASSLTACGEETGAMVGPGPADGGGGTGRYLPLAVGSTWTWRVTPAGGGATVEKISTVEAFEDVGAAKAGTMAFRVRTSHDDGSGGDTVSWQSDDGSSIVRQREQDFRTDGSMKTDSVYDPYKLRLDETAAHVASGADYQSSFTEVMTKIIDGSTTTLQKGETWTVVSTNESVTVPAGTFTCLHLHRVATDDTVGKDYWFARGVGKIKETGGQTEELSSYTLAQP